MVPYHFPFKVERNGQRLRLTIDGVDKDHYIRSRTSRLDLGTYLYLGAVDIPERLPWHLWTNKGKYYQGCLWDVRLNQKEHDLQQYLATQPMHGIDPGCQEMSLKCGSRPCLDGVCHERWGDYLCDCSETSKTGKMCEKRRYHFGLRSSLLRELMLTLLCSFHFESSLLFHKVF